MKQPHEKLQKVMGAFRIVQINQNGILKNVQMNHGQSGKQKREVKNGEQAKYKN